jgi:hypothetical protein
MSTPIPVIYIAGSSHSGSTLLDLLLGSHSKVESVGEAKKIPELMERIVRGESPMCTCQNGLAECTLWGPLVARGMGDLKNDPAANATLFRQILERQGKSVILDSSKTLGRSLLIGRSALFAPVFVHLVRDSRAVAYSSKRKRLQQKGRGHGTMETACGWRKLNARIPRRIGKTTRAPLLLVRYEDLIENPRFALQRILAAAGLCWEEPMLRFRDHVHHNVEGNRMRLASTSEIRCDDEYLRSLGALERLLVTLLTWRGLRKFGYPLKRSPVAAEAGRAAPSLR